MRVLILAATAAIALQAFAAVWAAQEAPEMATVEGEHVILKVVAEDLKHLDDPQGWVAKLDRAYEAYADLVGDVPFDGEKITILSVEDNPGGWAVAGNPVKWHRKWIVKSFDEGINKGDWSFGICHELGHDFDLDYRWVWDAELLANFKMDYVFQTAKAKVFFDNQICDYNDPKSLWVSDLYRIHEAKRRTSDRMLTGGWDEGIHSKYTDLVNELGWEPFKKTFRWFNSLDLDELPRDGLSKRSLFTRALEEQAGVKLSDRFIDWGFSHLTVDCETARQAAHLLRAKDWSARVAERPIDAAPGDKVTVRVEVAGLTHKELEKGLGTHAPAEIVYDLGGKYKEFESYIGVPGQVSLDGWGTVVFEVTADGKNVYESPILRGGGTYKQVALDVAGVKELKLICTDAGDGQSCDQAAWGDAKLTDADGNVTYLSDLKPVSAKQGYEVLHFDTDIDGEPLLFPFGPCAKQVKVAGEVDRKAFEMHQGAEPEAYEYTFDGFDKGTHLVWLTINVGDGPVTQHELVTIRVK
jgi:hypothetical protein